MNYPDLECPELGTLRYEEKYDWYEGKLKVKELDIAIQLSTDENNSVASAFKRATNLAGELKNYALLAQEFAAQRLLQLKNETWIDEGEDPLTTEQFQQWMTLESISIDSGGNVSFYHNDGDLFLGHCILVTMDSENNFIVAEIAG